MDKKSLFGALAVVSFVSILFTPADSNAWIYLLILGVVCGIGWLKS